MADPWQLKLAWAFVGAAEGLFNAENYPHYVAATLPAPNDQDQWVGFDGD